MKSTGLEIPSSPDCEQLSYALVGWLRASRSGLRLVSVEKERFDASAVDGRELLNWRLARELLEALPVGLVVTDAANSVLFANQKARALLCKTEYDALPRSTSRLPRDGFIWCNGGVIEVACTVVDCDGASFNSYTLSDRTELHGELRKLRQQCLSDDLTGLYNRRGFLTISRHHIDSARREGRKLLLIFGDLDGLKQINDSFGHAAGDAAIMDAAEILKASMRSSDIVARIGGDEFVILTTVTPGEQADTVVARLQAAFQLFNQEKERAYTLNISFGMAELDADGETDLAHLISRADCQMYKQKKNRRKLDVLPDGKSCCNFDAKKGLSGQTG